MLDETFDLQNVGTLDFTLFNISALNITLKFCVNISDSNELNEGLGDGPGVGPGEGAGGEGGEGDEGGAGEGEVGGEGAGEGEGAGDEGDAGGSVTEGAYIGGDDGGGGVGDSGGVTDGLSNNGGSDEMTTDSQDLTTEPQETGPCAGNPCGPAGTNCTVVGLDYTCNCTEGYEAGGSPLQCLGKYDRFS